MTYRKILVPYDGSKPSDNALFEAIKLGRLTPNTQIILLNVVSEIDIPPMYEIILDRQFIPKEEEYSTLEEYKKILFHQLKKQAKAILEYKKEKNKQDGIFIDTVILYGNPSEKIIELAANENVDLIIMGNVGLRRLSKIKALGSVSRNVIERSSCPILIVK